MKKLFLLLGGILFLATTGCVVREHDYRGGYYGHPEYGHGEYHYYHHDWDHDHDRW
jgi:hypothetical protein